MPSLNPKPSQQLRAWRSLEELAEAHGFRELLRNEFPAGAAWLDDVEHGATGMRRRRFIQLMGASFGLAGLTGCGRQAVEHIRPYVEQPEELMEGSPLFYATAVPFRGHARGVLVKSHFGRPIKLEGNPAHPSSLGACDATTQATVLDLYDPDRSRVVKHQGQISTWDRFEEAHRLRREQHVQAKGRGYAVLIEPTASPTLQRLLSEVLARLPEARVFQHAAVAPVAPEPLVDFSSPDLMVNIDDDFLASHPESLRFTRQFTKRRRAGAEFNRLYVIEPTPTLTGAMADHRLAVRPSRIPMICSAVVADDLGGDILNQAEADFVQKLRDDLGRFAGQTLVRSNATESSAVQRLLARSMKGETVPPTITAFPGLAELTTALEVGEVETLIILGGNPAYCAPGNIGFAAALSKVPFTAHLGSHEDETSALCQWHLPEAHLLETWGDLYAYDGTPTIQQPLINPMYEGRPAIAVLSPARDVHETVRETWRRLGAHSEEAFEPFWRRTLHDGLAPKGSLARVAGIPLLEHGSDAEPGSESRSIDLVLRPDAWIGGGERSNNGWLQELPRPFTKLVWDNAALISPAFAKRLGVATGDIVSISRGNSQPIDAPVWILPGQADQTITLHLGYGRRSAGLLGTGVGFDAFPLVGAEGAIVVRPTGRRHELVTTQHHSVMEGRELIWRLKSKELANSTLPDRPPKPSDVTLYPKPQDILNGRFAWAMSINLGACIGCSACVTACQAENNIPVVGREEVSRGREMHWIRIDRYFAGEDPDTPEILHQPVTCQQCEQAPCEVVCPVEATVHTADGLNAMVYNRCVGTRYCSNNCPYKVRRFNFFDYRPKKPKTDPRSLQFNPEVTVRGRGVMEKCTYCVQRIQNAVIRSDREKRRLRDGEIVTACQQACPADAIVFGDLRDAESRVAILRKEPTAYALLGELNTRPRTTYLAKLTNPHA